jgi:AraC family chemosensory pili system transcriptional regulator ChpD
MRSKRIVATNFEAAFIWGDRLTFEYHSHDEYVLSCNISGNERLVLDGRALEAPENCTTLYNPGQIQKGDGTSCLVSIYLDPHFFEREGLSEREVAYGKPIVDDGLLRAQFTGLAGLILNQSQAAVEEAVFGILDAATSRYVSTPMDGGPSSYDPRVRRVQELLLERLDEHVGLDEIASEVGLNKLALLRMFTKATGLPPIAWQRAKRIEAARRLLKTGITAADTAYMTGFSDQAHLTRWFGRAYGISPGRFARG